MTGADGASLLEAARRLEGGRRERALEEHDVAVFLATIRKYPGSRISVYAGRGAYVPNSYGRATMTVLDYWPAADGGPRVAVSEGDARRPKGRGPWVEVDGKKEI